MACQLVSSQSSSISWFLLLARPAPRHVGVHIDVVKGHMARARHGNVLSELRAAVIFQAGMRRQHAVNEIDICGGSITPFLLHASPWRRSTLYSVGFGFSWFNICDLTISPATAQTSMAKGHKCRDFGV